MKKKMKHWWRRSTEEDDALMMQWWRSGLTDRKLCSNKFTWCFHKPNYYMFYRHANIQRTYIPVSYTMSILMYRFLFHCTDFSSSSIIYKPRRASLPVCLSVFNQFVWCFVARVRFQLYTEKNSTQNIAKNAPTYWLKILCKIIQI
jgi:hypothetical protein